MKIIKNNILIFCMFLSITRHAWGPPSAKGKSILQQDKDADLFKVNVKEVAAKLNAQIKTATSTQAQVAATRNTSPAPTNANAPVTLGKATDNTITPAAAKSSTLSKPTSSSKASGSLPHATQAFVKPPRSANQGRDPIKRLSTQPVKSALKSSKSNSTSMSSILDKYFSKNDGYTKKVISFEGGERTKLSNPNSNPNAVSNVIIGTHFKSNPDVYMVTRYLGQHKIFIVDIYDLKNRELIVNPNSSRIFTLEGNNLQYSIKKNATDTNPESLSISLLNKSNSIPMDNVISAIEKAILETVISKDATKNLPKNKDLSSNNNHSTDIAPSSTPVENNGLKGLNIEPSYKKEIMKLIGEKNEGILEQALNAATKDLPPALSQKFYPETKTFTLTMQKNGDASHKIILEFEKNNIIVKKYIIKKRMYILDQNTQTKTYPLATP